MSPSVIFSNDNVIGEESMGIVLLIISFLILWTNEAVIGESVRLLSGNSTFFTKYQLDTSVEGFLGSLISPN